MGCKMKPMDINKIAGLDMDNRFYNKKLNEIDKLKDLDATFKKRKIKSYKNKIKKNEKIIKQWQKAKR